MKMNEKIIDRMKTLDAQLKLGPGHAILMSQGEIAIIHRLNLMVGLMTLMIDEEVIG